MYAFLHLLLNALRKWISRRKKPKRVTFFPLVCTLDVLTSNYTVRLVMNLSVKEMN